MNYLRNYYWYFRQVSILTIVKDLVDLLRVSKIIFFWIKVSLILISTFPGRNFEEISGLWENVVNLVSNGKMSKYEILVSLGEQMSRGKCPMGNYQLGNCQGTIFLHSLPSVNSVILFGTSSIIVDRSGLDISSDLPLCSWIKFFCLAPCVTYLLVCVSFVWVCICICVGEG